MDRSNVERLVALGALNPLPGLVREPPVIDDVTACKTVVERQKTLQIAGGRLTDFAGKGEGTGRLVDLRDRLETAAAQARNRAAQIEDADAYVQRLADETGTRTYLLKGMAFRRWYADPAQREVGDLDLWIPDIDEAWALVNRLRDDGWEYQASELPWVKRDLPSGLLYGQARLWSRHSEPTVYIDVHFGRFYSVRHCAVIPLKPAPEGRCVDGAENLAAMIGNAAGDHFITVKDLNDLYIALSRDDIAWARLVDLLRTARLTGFFALMLARLRQFMSLEEGQLDRLRDLPPVGAREYPPPALTEWTLRKRWLVTTWHAARTARATKGLGTYRSFFGAMWYYARPLRLRVVEQARRPVRLAQAGNATCVRFVPTSLLPGRHEPRHLPAAPEPVALTGAESIRTVAAPWGDVVLSGSDVFVPTINYAVDRRVAEFAVGLGQSLRSG